MKNLWVISFLIILSLIVLGCPMPPTSETGNLTISLTSAMDRGAKNLLPPIDMNVATYDVSGTGPSSATFSQQNVTTPLTVNSLVAGSWSITVNGKNSAGTVIGTGTTSVTVVAGQTANASVTVSPLNGNGDLSLSVSWLTGLVAAPSVSGTLTLVGGSASNINFALAGNSLSASYDSGSTLAAGYYTLSLVLQDGTTTVWGGIEAVRIVAGNTTTGTFALSSSDINPLAGMIITITPAMNNPITIALSGQQASLSSGTSMTVVATPSSSVSSYQWFLNGAPISGQTASSCSVGSGLSAGNYRLDVVGTQGSILASTHCAFQVVPPFFIAGFTGNTLTTPCYWLNGTLTNLPIGSGNVNRGQTTGVVLDSAGNVYVAGYVSGTDTTPCYWKNGTLNTLPSVSGTTDDSADGIALDSAGNVYVAGCAVSSQSTPCYWKNGTLNTLPIGSGKVNGWTEGVAVDSGGNSYIVGFVQDGSSYETPCYWKNGTLYPLPIGSGNINGVAMNVVLDSSGNLYIAGTVSSSTVETPCCWKNGTLYTLPISSGNIQGVGNGVALDSAGNVYVAGYMLNATSYTPCYWKNGTLTTLPIGSGNVNGFSYGVGVGSGGNSYIVGTVSSSTGSLPGDTTNMPCYWKNGTLYTLPIDTGNTYGVTSAVGF